MFENYRRLIMAIVSHEHESNNFGKTDHVGILKGLLGYEGGKACSIQSVC